MITLRLARAFNMGIKSLLLHPLRSSLTALSMLFGVGAVIAMLAVGEGASRQAQEQFQALGANTIVIESVKKAVAKESEERNPLAYYGLTFIDLERIRQTLPAVEVSVPVRDLRKDVWYKARRFAGGRVVGTVPWFAEVQRLIVASGRWISALDQDERRLSRAVVLGSDVAKALFPLEDPLGKTVSISNNSFRVVGVLAPQAGTDQRTKMNLANLNTNAYVAIRSLTAYLGEFDIERTSGSDIREKVELRQIIIRVKDIDDVIPTAAALTNLLDAKHPDKDYRMVVPLQAIRQAQESARMFGFFLACIGAISLFVGGIGIMNIMLATVTERTREIGIRRALGARKSHIIMQFLVETVVLTMVGGLFGAAAGISSHWLIPLIYPGRLAIVTSGQVALSFLISAGVGVAFGLYPAWRAANMDPIEALRHE